MSTIGGILLAVALGVGVLVWRLLYPAPPLQITDRGILDRRLAFGWLDWDSIEGAYRPRTPDGNRVLLRVRVDDRLARERLARGVSATETPHLLELSLNLAGTPYSEVDVLHEVMAHARSVDQAAPIINEATQLPCR